MPAPPARDVALALAGLGLVAVGFAAGVLVQHGHPCRDCVRVGLDRIRDRFNGDVRGHAIVTPEELARAKRCEDVLFEDPRKWRGC